MKIILEGILRKEGRCGLDSSGSDYGQVADPHEHAIKHLGAIKAGNFLDSCVIISFSKRLFFMDLVS